MYDVICNVLMVVNLCSYEKNVGKNKWKKNEKKKSYQHETAVLKPNLNTLWPFTKWPQTIYKP